MSSFQLRCHNLLGLMARDGDIWWKLLRLKSAWLHFYFFFSPLCYTLPSAVTAVCFCKSSISFNCHSNGLPPWVTLWNWAESQLSVFLLKLIVEGKEAIYCFWKNIHTFLFEIKASACRGRDYSPAGLLLVWCVQETKKITATILVSLAY